MRCRMLVKMNSSCPDLDPGIHLVPKTLDSKENGIEPGQAR